MSNKFKDYCKDIYGEGLHAILAGNTLFDDIERKTIRKNNKKFQDLIIKMCVGQYDYDNTTTSVRIEGYNAIVALLDYKTLRKISSEYNYKQYKCPYQLDTYTRTITFTTKEEFYAFVSKYL